MAKKELFRVEGLSDLLEGLQELPKATANNTLKRFLIQVAEPIRSDAERRAPHETGRLQRSIVVGTKLSRRQRAQHEKKSAVEVFVGPGSMPRAITQEFGAAQHGPKPYMRPAWDANNVRAFETMRDLLAAEIEKAAARIARKAARQAAKAAK
jgi:HK97 gp10 family phage protein